MLLWIFGNVIENEVEVIEDDHASGTLKLDRANVKWSLSINADHLPENIKAEGKRTFRSLQIEGREIEFSDGFTGLHTKCYEQILSGNGFGLSDARPSIETVFKIRKA